MLEYCLGYEDEIHTLFRNNVIKKKEFSYYDLRHDVDYSPPEIVVGEDVVIQRISIGPRDPAPLAFFEARVDKRNFLISNISIVSLVPFPSPLIIKDLLTFVNTLLFKERKFRKINFDAVRGNPANRIYQKYIEKHPEHCRVVGTLKEEVFCNDGIYRDLILYEVMNPFFTWKVEKN